MRRILILGVALLLWAAAADPLTANPTAQEDLVYDLPLPAGRPVSYTIDFDVSHPGRLEVTGDWTGNRVLSFRLEELSSLRPVDPAHGPQPQGEPLRRSGPSPQALVLEVPNPGDYPRDYRLQIRGLALRENASGKLTIRRPQPPPPPPPLLETLPPPTPPAVPESVLPAGSPASWRRFSDTADWFADTVKRDPRGDPCRWQAGLAGYLLSRRDALVAGEPPPAQETVEALASIVGIVRRVEALRTSEDPVVAGPPPDERGARQLWTRVRDERIQIVEAELDSLLAGIERGHAPELAESPWPFRLVSCVIGCERYFEERVRVGEKKAVNRDLATTQWPRLLEAADLLQSMIRLRAGSVSAVPPPSRTDTPR